VLADEQFRLGEEYDANDSPPVKRESAKLAALEAMLNRISTQPIGDVFADAAIVLLGDGAAGKDKYRDAHGNIFALVDVRPVSAPDLTAFEKTHTLRSVDGRHQHQITRQDFEKNFVKI
jgi:hypothetical protein